MTASHSGTRFAVYFVPPAEHPFYQVGSRLLGRDLRANQLVSLPDFLRPEWQASAAPYGLHLTVVEGFFTDAEALPAIEAEARACRACLSPGADLMLRGGHLDVWDDGAVWVQRYTPTPAFSVLHTLLLARLAPFVTASPFAVRSRPAFEEARMRLLHTPRGLDTFEPHFTLIEPYGGGDPAGLRQHLQPLLAPFETLEVGTLALCIKPAGETNWQIQAEF
ncbi:hypothetical protein [Deinococcus sp.]|uniref:hypothetical protein n=1 Tax=Deinococcus sp. TaxID=47478 RepID=UPI003B59CE71